MYLRQLRYFVAIVETGSFSKAAQSLRIAQPALSLHIKNMEADFGAALLVRSPHGVLPTLAGQILLRDSRLIIERFESMRERIRIHAASRPAGPVRLGIPSLLAMVVGDQLASESRRRFPAIDLVLSDAVSGHVVDWLRDGTVDAGLLYTPFETDDLVSTKLLTESLMLVARAGSVSGEQRIAPGATVALEDLANLPILLPASGHTLRDYIESHLATRGITLRGIIEFDTNTSLLKLVKDGAGYSIFPASSIREGIGAGALRAWPIGRPKLMSSVYFVQPRDASARSAAFDCILQLCRVTLPNAVQDQVA